jgi:GAF domain-containing protein
MPASDRTERGRSAEARRLRELLETARSLASDQALESVLDEVVASASHLVGAEQGVLAVLASDSSLEQFAHHGLAEADVERVRSVMHRRLVKAAGTPDDVTDGDDIAADPRAEGFPLPDARSALVVPLRLRGTLSGELVLADPAVGRFSEADELYAATLALTIGAAIENARLYAEARHSRAWFDASGEVARALLAGADVEVLVDVVARAFDIAEADYAALILPTEDGRLQVAIALGVGADEFRGAIFPPFDFGLGKAIAAGTSARTDDMTTWTSDAFENTYDFGPAMIAPLSDAAGRRGGVLLVRRSGRRPFTGEEAEQATAFAGQVAVALRLSEARADAEWLRVVEDRHRIAQDLHDNVIQRLFATGVGLQMLSEQRLDAVDTERRLQRHIADLDETIEEIRGRVFGLQSSGRPPRRQPGHA